MFAALCAEPALSDLPDQVIRARLPQEQVIICLQRWPVLGRRAKPPPAGTKLEVVAEAGLATWPNVQGWWRKGRVRRIQQVAAQLGAGLALG